MKKITSILKKDPMLAVAIAAALISLFITKPTAALFTSIDWHTLGTLFMMLTVLEGFKRENIFKPLIQLGSRFKTIAALTFFLVFGVFFTSMFVTNDVSLIIFVPLTIMLFRGSGHEAYILPVLTFENIAAIRGSLLMPFGSPQNLFLYAQSGTSAANFILHMSPLCVMSAALLSVFILVLYRRNLREPVNMSPELAGVWKEEGKVRRITYICLFLLILFTIVSRTQYWPAALVIVIAAVLLTGPALFTQVDYALLGTFLCFFIFSSQIAANEAISDFLSKAVAGNEYWWVIGLSQIISNVPASIVLYPFTENFAGLIYGADTAGLCSLIGSLASVINFRIYVREYPGGGGRFVKVFTLISWAFFIIVVIPGFLLSSWRFF